MTIFLQALNCLIDAYLVVAASAIVANTFLRSFFRAGFLLFATAMFNNLGVDWAGSLLGFLAVAFRRFLSRFIFLGRG
jgi:DHA1 family multidrug resistance protein-like MFS transporter